MHTRVGGAVIYTPKVHYSIFDKEVSLCVADVLHQQPRDHSRILIRFVRINFGNTLFPNHVRFLFNSVFGFAEKCPTHKQRAERE